MSKPTSCSTQTAPMLAHRPRLSADARRWAKALAITAALLALFFVAARYAARSAPANHRRCIEAVAADAHLSAAALFQDPALQDALVEAETRCSR